MGQSAPILALSTAWCSHRHTDGYGMAREMVDLGFEHLELSHGIRISLVPGIIKAVGEGWVKISSVHNFCPLPPGVNQAAPNLFEPSSTDARERSQWLRHTKRSLDFAEKIGAPAMVCHLGSVHFFWINPARKLLRHRQADPARPAAEDPEYQEILKKSLAKLRKRMPVYWENTKNSLNQVFGYAAQKGIRLGLENREKFEELPVDADFPEFLAGLPAGSPAGYWHDTGHADIKEKLGLLNHREQLEKNASRLIGFHLHDVDADNHDHRPIGSGRVDFNMVREFWRPEHRLVLELGPSTKVEEVISSRERVRALLAA